VLIFMYLIYRIFTDGIALSSNYWHSPEFFYVEGDVISVSSLEWSQNSPPTLHTFEELPYLVSHN
jgi:hypothetical protein